MEDIQVARQVSQGKCNLCGGTFSKQAMTKHVKSCSQKEGSCGTPAKRGSRKTKTFHLMVEGRYLPDYWMYLEVPATAKLADLDDFLRQIWLECCGHMSMFTIEGKRYPAAPLGDVNEGTMGIKLDDVLHPHMTFYHEYDFGSTTHLALKVIAEQESDIKGKSVRLLARNEPAAIACVSCGKTATQVCTECLWSGQGWLCDGCAAEHRCGEDMLLPVVNSPRVGVCGYDGR
jgi:hypothetical protein